LQAHKAQVRPGDRIWDPDLVEDAKGSLEVLAGDFTGVATLTLKSAALICFLNSADPVPSTAYQCPHHRRGDAGISFDDI
jgi:hypothetical protein